MDYPTANAVPVGEKLAQTAAKQYKAFKEQEGIGGTGLIGKDPDVAVKMNMLKGHNARLWEALLRLEDRLLPVLRSQPECEGSDKAAPRFANCPISAALQEEAFALENAIAKVEMLTSRLEI